ncbi:poly(U)-specific endoribonuclease-B-like [Mercenaria mercenaria]|uniref:poly(U)-specific endoribonuclease-B-like n=1 Tax=Mercenaria mercenaria TaxID=6596 RepID=UPI001E1DA99B|nr:poly(U)-specific endoribonuclease-B-like [Mercenaria mercenaria]
MAQYKQQQNRFYNERGFQPDEELSEILTKLWNLDDNKCYPDKDFTIDLQRYVSYHRREDQSSEPLFQWLDESVFERETYRTFRALLNNYEMQCGEAEVVTREEIMENREFINAIMETEVMKECHRYLIKEGKAPEDVGKFKCQVYNLWFMLIRRTKGDRDQDSSSFEHVFVGEYRNKEFIGLHNWIQIYLLEKAGKIDYHGYLKRDTIKQDQFPRLLALQFTYHDEEDGPMEKPVCSTFLGTSPEFEIAAYTLCFFHKQGKIDVQLDEYEVEMACLPLGKNHVGTAYIAAAKF